MRCMNRTDSGASRVRCWEWVCPPRNMSPRPTFPETTPIWRFEDGTRNQGCPGTTGAEASARSGRECHGSVVSNPLPCGLARREILRPFGRGPAGPMVKASSGAPRGATGEMEKIRNWKEIEAAPTVEGRNEGLLFEVAILGYCGGRCQKGLRSLAARGSRVSWNSRGELTWMCRTPADSRNPDEVLTSPPILLAPAMLGAGAT